MDTLCIYGNCDLDNESLKNLNLKKLMLWDTPKITDINHMTNLEDLTIMDDKCGIDDNGIKKIKCQKITCWK